MLAEVTASLRWLTTRPTFRPDSRQVVNLQKRTACTKIKVYTRTGDKGTTSLYTGERKRKDDDVFQALGATDHLNAQIGLAREYCKSNGLDDYLAQIQSRLLDLGSHIATPPESASDKHLARAAFPENNVQLVEQWIDKLDEELPPLRHFILPGGGLASSHLHLCRTSCRTAERNAISLDHYLDPEVIRYLNRLSDFFFVSARFAAMKDGVDEVTYKKAKTQDNKQPEQA